MGIFYNTKKQNQAESFEFILSLKSNNNNRIKIDRSNLIILVTPTGFNISSWVFSSIPN